MRRRAGGRGPAVALALALLAVSPAAAQSPGSPGERAFQRCFSCHDVHADAQPLQGPNLRRLIGRRAGTLPSFEYSEAMKEAGARGLVWTPAMLDRYLEDPEAFVPGGRMAGVWLRDPEQRRILIEWLAEATR